MTEGEEEDFQIPKCNLSKVESLKDYFSKETGPKGECRPCRLKPLASLYLGALQKAGATEDAEALSAVYDTKDILTIAEAMDIIKERVKENKQQLHKDLGNLDCFVESYEDE